MADNFNLRTFLTENKLTKNAKLLKEEQEGYRYFEEEGNGGFYLDTVDGHKIYSMEDSSVMDTCFYAIEDPNGDVEFIAIDVAGEPISSEQLQNEYELLSYVADFIEADIAKELGQEGGDDLNEVSEYGHGELMDAVDDYCDSDSPQFSKLQTAVDDAYEAGQIDTSEFGHDPSAAYRAVEAIAKESGLFDEPDRDMGWDERDDVEEAYTPKSKLEIVIQKAWAETDLEKAKQLVRDLIEPSRVKSKDTILQTIKGIGSKPKLDQYLANSLLKFEKLGLNETTNKMTAKELKLVQMVKEAMGMEGYGNDNVNLKRDKEGLPPIQGPTYSEGEEIAEEEMVEKEPLPKYESIEKLMQEIEEGTNKAMYEYKIKAMEEIASKLEEKANSLEEGEHKEYINPQEIKKLRKDLGDIRRQVEKLRKEFDKKFNKKEKAAAPKEEKEPVALAEGFDLRKFLAENRK